MMALSHIPLAVPDLRGRECEYLLECVRDNWVSSAGPHVRKLEEEMARLTHRRHAVAVVNGTAALHLALVAAGVKPGQKVVVPDWTFAAPANAVCHAGAVPYFVDVSPETWSLDPKLVEDVLSGGDEIAAVIMVDALGHPADADPIAAACRKRKIPLIEDAAGAIGAAYRGRPCGSLGDVSIISFNGNKTVTAGGGGVLLTDDPKIAETARHVSTQARTGADYVHDTVGFNYRMTNVNAAIALAQLDRLDEMVARKREIAAAYDAAIAGRNDMVAMPRMSWAHSGCWLYSVRLASEADAASLITRLAEQNIEARNFWRSLSAQKPWAASKRMLRGTSVALSGCVVSLPCSTAMTDEDQKRVIAVIKAWSGSDARPLDGK